MARAGAGLGALLAGLLVGACDPPCCTFDSRPIPLSRGPAGELIVTVAGPEGPAPALVDTGSPVTFWRRPTDTPARVVRHDLTLLGAASDGGEVPVRALLRDVDAVEAPLGALGTAAAPLLPQAVLGGDLWTAFSIELAFAPPALTFWRRQAASDSFLGRVGYAVLHLPRRGGGQLLALGPSDWFGQRSAHEYPPSRLLLRACAAPAAFDRQAPPPTRCCRGEEHRLRTGTDLSLLLATGVGPLVLGRAAWERVSTGLASPPPPPTAGELRLALVAEPVPALFTRLTGLALVDREADLASDPGPCAELARSRRLELVAISQAANPARAACALPCDRDPRDPGRAQNSAAYLELTGTVEVAIVEDTTPFLQAIRAEVRPQAPEVDGLLGAAALAASRVELDYLANETRAIWSCETQASAQESMNVGDGVLAPAPACRAVPRCPRLPSAGQTRACFGLPAHGLPEMCEDADQCRE